MLEKNVGDAIKELEAYNKNVKNKPIDKTPYGDKKMKQITYNFKGLTGSGGRGNFNKITVKFFLIF